MRAEEPFPTAYFPSTGVKMDSSVFCCGQGGERTKRGDWVSNALGSAKEAESRSGWFEGGVMDGEGEVSDRAVLEGTDNRAGFSWVVSLAFSAVDSGLPSRSFGFDKQKPILHFL